MPNPTKSDPLGTHLRNVAQDGEAEQQLVFDPRSGELTLAPRHRAPASPDAVVVDQIAEDGFFVEEDVP